ncbi:hypothetical protein QWY28_10760 [Nocardioides sp. SOB77]|uniref:Uncharacterized protein n=1 Tax=Nocardioides oceani TaxID=3058369 RepID=A0ABT8FFW4_9ACTN|nr:hypothetical protein [Nocardioides oceani]MDN4173425.1 hypothetical protein [Nocardioides oceani]
MHTSSTFQSEIDYRSTRIRRQTGAAGPAGRRRHRVPLVRRPAGGDEPQR